LESALKLCLKQKKEPKGPFKIIVLQQLYN